MIVIVHLLSAHANWAQPFKLQFICMWMGCALNEIKILLGANDENMLIFTTWHIIPGKYTYVLPIMYCRIGKRKSQGLLFNVITFWITWNEKIKNGIN